MSELLIKNACVIDPLRRINAETMDIAIRDGKIVEDVSSAAEVIDAHGALTLPGGIDSHTHVCGTKVNFGRYMSPEDMRAGRTPRRGAMHATSGYSVPTTYGNSYRYSAMGYTTLLEGAMAPLEARHTHEEFVYTPLQDTMANTLFDGNWGGHGGDPGRRHETGCGHHRLDAPGGEGVFCQTHEPGGYRGLAMGQERLVHPGPGALL